MDTFEQVGRFCEPQTKAYLECRMAVGLMQKEPMENLGFKTKQK